MTVIAAIVNDEGAFMASDSRVCRGAEYLDGIVKVHRYGLSLIGNSGYNHFDDCIRRVWPTVSREHDAEDIESFCRVLARSLMDHRQQTAPPGEDPHWCSVLIATLHGIFRVDAAGAVVKVPRSWDADGSGGSEARAVLWSASMRLVNRSVRRSPEALLKTAVDAAVALDSGCGGHVCFESIPRLAAPGPTNA